LVDENSEETAEENMLIQQGETVTGDLVGNLPIEKEDLRD
jgi:hypothetical protein